MTTNTSDAIPSNISIITSTSTIDSLHSDLLQKFLNGSLILGTFVFFINLYISTQLGNLVSTFLTFTIFAVLFSITFLKRIKSSVRLWLLFLVFLGTGVFSLLTAGLNANGLLYFFIGVLILGIVANKNMWMVGFLLSGITLIGLGILVRTLTSLNSLQIIAIDTVYYWILTSVITLFLVYIIVTPLSAYLTKIKNKLDVIAVDQTNLQSANQNLSSQLESRNSEFDKRKSRFSIVHQISRELARIESNDELLQKAVDLIQSLFSYNYVGVFLIDDTNEFAVFRAGTGPEGQKLLDQNHKIRVREESIVNSVITQGEARIVLDIETDNALKPTMMFPETRSEMLVPLKYGDHILGILDIHSENENAFDVDNMDNLQSVADQLSTLYEKSLKIELLENSIVDLKQTAAVYSQSFWRAHLRGSKKNLSFRFSNNQIEKKLNVNEDELKVLQTANKIVIPSNSDTNNSALLVPIKIRDQVIGVLKLNYQGKNIPYELDQLIDEASTRLASSIENARLLEEIQEQVDREKVVSTIANKVRSATNIDTILQTTIEELGRTLGVNEVSIQLKTTENE